MRRPRWSADVLAGGGRWRTRTFEGNAGGLTERCTQVRDWGLGAVAWIEDTDSTHVAPARGRIPGGQTGPPGTRAERAWPANAHAGLPPPRQDGAADHQPDIDQDSLDRGHAAEVKPMGVAGGASWASAGSLGCRTACRRPTGVARGGRCRRPPGGTRAHQSIWGIASYRAPVGLVAWRNHVHAQRPHAGFCPILRR